MKDLNYLYLREQLHYNLRTGIFTRKVSNNSRYRIGDIAGSRTSKGYIEIGINNNRYYAHRLAWLYVYGYMPKNDIDHKDRIRYHNWIANLRESMDSCNQINTGNSKANKSGIKGVCWDQNANKWKGFVYINSIYKHLGIYKDFTEAVCHRLAAEQCLNWDKYDRNSSAYQYVKLNILEKTE